MSGLVATIVSVLFDRNLRNTLTGSDPHGTNTHSTTTTQGTTTTAGPHQSNITNKLEPRADSDLDGSRNARARRADNIGSTTVGPHSTNAANKPTLVQTSSTHASTLTTATAEPPYGSSHTHGSTATNTGPHQTDAVNKLDPCIDCDRDHHGTASTSTGGAYGSTYAAPQSSNVTNKVNPRIDSDRDHRDTTTTSSGLGGTSNPHTSSLANKADPRVDTDRRTSTTGAFGSSHSHDPTGLGTHSATGETGHTTAHAHGGTTLNSGTITSGLHRSDVANKVDPKVDSDRGHRGSYAAYSTGP
ncbi:hypothetical protein BDD12DRAFT_917647 [Trichophaea hybrida]|nr:hypothetical protein BDD12DRAFT_917647 [Trichophaea hybrida]